MPTTRIYRSTDTSAPVLVGGVSSLIDLIDKCLVVGYGAKTAAGWTKPFTGTNLAAFRNSVAAGGTGMYLRVDDSGAGTGGARSARLRAYLTMSGISTGTIPTPTTAQLSAGVIWRKSNTVDSAARAWILIADELTMYLCIDAETGVDAGFGAFAAGDFQSFVPGDPYRFFLAGRETQGGAGDQGAYTGLCLGALAAATPASDGFYVARGVAGTGNPLRANLASLLYNIPIGTASALANPGLGTGLAFWIPGFIVGEAGIRGRMRGVHVPLSSHAGVAMGANVVNPPGLAATTLTTLRHNLHDSQYDGTFDCHLHVDITNAWPV